ncbi:ACP S-malonyltransferase [Clostridium felsineum]|uniref:ACP S-malonyltransferase n=1 Tax=Clostridium felsineum TaxID=36839 RepID=UPI00098CE5E8|nr:ACP S-malonyltransferase [Clostridium felsineum]URZ00197.1 hypothetical protein CLAUR_001850 [Clostridium felsineum]
MNKIGAVFSGQGSQYVGMGKELCENFLVAKETFQEANEKLKFDLMKLCFGGDENELKRPENCQPAVLTVSTALYRVFSDEFGVKPKIFAGHSLGEYSALTCEGSVSFSDALAMVKKRGELIGKAATTTDGTMAAIIDINSDIIEDYCNERKNDSGILSVSNYNTEKQTVISGNVGLVDEAAKYFENIGATVKRLNVTGGFHSLLLSDAAVKFKSFLEDYEFLDPKQEVISNTNGLPYKNGKDIKDKLVKQIVQPVKWVDTMNYFLRTRIDTVIEFGPKKTLRNFFRSLDQKLSTFSYDDPENFNEVRKQLKDTSIIAEQYRDFIQRCIAIIACTKNNAINEDIYKKNVIDTCTEIRSIEKSIITYDSNTLELCKKVLQLTQIALDTKMVPQIEREERFKELIVKSGNYELESMIDRFCRVL